MIDINHRHLADVLNEATAEELEEGIGWYPREGAWVDTTAFCYQATRDQVAAITAVLSAQAPWDVDRTRFPGQWTNKLLTITILDILCDCPDMLHEATLFATHKVRDQCRAIYENPDYVVGPELGPKKYPFARNLLGDLDAFTCDQYAFAAAIDWRGPMSRLPEITRRRREQAKEAYEWVAHELGVKLAQGQAAIWVPYRRIRRER